MRCAEEEEIKHSIETQGLMCYNQQLLDDYRNSSNEVYVVSSVSAERGCLGSVEAE